MAHSSQLKAQNTFTVKYKYRITSEMGDSFYFQIIRPAVTIAENNAMSNFHPLLQSIFIKTDSVHRENICTYGVSDTACAQFWDGFGYESFVIPGDTIEVTIEKKQLEDGGYWVNKKKNFKSVWFHNHSFSGKNKYIYSLFDSLQYETGMIQFGSPNLQKANLNLNTYFQMTLDLFNSRVGYLNNYCKTYSIPNVIYHLAYSEIRSAYIIGLISPMYNNVVSFTLSDYTKEYLDSLNGFRNLNDEYVFLKSFLYRDAVYEYIGSYRNKLLLNISDDEILFNKTYQCLKIAEKDKRVLQQALLGFCLLSNLKNKFNSFPSYLSDYKKLFPKSGSYQYLDSLYVIEKSKPVFTMEEALASEIVDDRNKKSTFKQKMTNKLTYVDCWASWCIPCLSQMPYEEELKKLYAGKIDFIYLSFDRDEGKWIEKNKDLKLSENSYVLTNNFKSDFGYYFDIESIPRYLLFDANGKLVNSKMPRPSQKAKLAELLDKSLSDAK